ncbi:hypothetical protein DXB58_13845 [Bacteroides sp. OM05-10AA]|nr:hypothetical protein DXB58_13845 [Bacteroides sp. OM05-10AA]RGQ65052.1 hypothetical protein DWY87_15265 [Bacteroides sp. AF27-33]
MLFSFNKSYKFLVKSHLAEVCPLSCEVMLQPLSIPLQNGVRFLRIPLPAFHSASLTVCLPVVTQEKYGFTMFLVHDK